MNLRIGSRIFLKQEFCDRIIKSYDRIKSINLDKSSLAFGIVALTDYAINLKNLRTGKLYTVPIGELQGNVDETVDDRQPPPKRENVKKEIVTINSPIKMEEPIKPKKDFVYETTTATLHFPPVDASAILVAGPFAYLYE